MIAYTLLEVVISHTTQEVARLDDENHGADHQDGVDQRAALLAGADGALDLLARKSPVPDLLVVREATQSHQVVTDGGHHLAHQDGTNSLF